MELKPVLTMWKMDLLVTWTSIIVDGSNLDFF
jgi:hypothetical protein